MISDAGSITVIYFSDVSILPSSFASYSLYGNRLGFDIRGKVWISTTEGVDNTPALLAVSGWMAITGYFLSRLGQRLPGGYKDTQNSIGNSVTGSH